MSKTFATLGLILAYFQYVGLAAPTWPASIDELEDILFLGSGYRARGFAAQVSPCSSAFEPGRITSAAWVRTAFHDAATGNTFFGTGGLDGSIQFELNYAENVGNKAIATAVGMWAPFLSNRTSLADVVAAGLYASVRSCNGPAVPIRGGRIDATRGGQIGAVPLPQNTVGTFGQQFSRIGINATEMIQIVACGHTLGGVHASDTPQVITPGTFPNDFAPLDTTPSAFDTNVASEYVSGTTKNPLVVGPSVASGRNSDGKVFGSDSNVTITAMQNAQTFSSVCQSLFQRMIEIVPTGVKLTDVITPYDVKPYGVQLTLLAGGTKIKFSGDIRVRTTERKNIAQVQLIYKDRAGTTVSTPIDTAASGTASGFDDTFGFFGFSVDLPAVASISSFDVVIAAPGGSSQTFNNNGNSFKVDDTIIYQEPQSCSSGGGKLTAVAAVRDGAGSPRLQVVAKVPRASSDPNPVPSLSTTNIPMATQSTVGAYQLYSADYTSPSSLTSDVFGVYAGNSADTYKSVGNLPTACKTLDVSPPTSVPSSAPFEFQGCYYDAAVPRALPSDSFADDNMTVERCSTFCAKYPLFGVEYGRECYCGNARDATSTIQSISDCNMPCSGNNTEICGAGNRLSLYKQLNFVPAPVPTEPPTLSGYDYVGCLADNVDDRTLYDRFRTTSDNNHTTCASFCSGYEYFGVEFGSECYCGISLKRSNPKPLADCSMPCSGAPKSFCGAASLLTVFRDKNKVSPPQNPQLASHTYKGCYIDSQTSRTLPDNIYYDGTMTVEKCAANCKDYKFFGTEYGSQCFCGNTLPAGAGKANEADCQFLCGGNSAQLCGAGDRLSLYEKNA